MTKVDIQIYKGFLKLLKDGKSINKSSLAREAFVCNKTIRNKIEKHTFQDLTRKVY